MKRNNPIDSNLNNRIELSELLGTLLNSKRKIIILTLIITLISSVYYFQRLPSFESNVLIEIGSKQNNDLNDLIEDQQSLIEEMTIQFIHKPNNALKGGSLNFDSLENRLLIMTYTSNLMANHKQILNELFIFIENRHSNLLTNINLVTNNEIIRDIDKLDNKIEFFNENYSVKIDKETNNIINEINTLKNKIEFLNDKYKVETAIEKLNIDALLPELESKIFSLKIIINDDKENLSLLESNPDSFLERAAQSPTLNQIIHSYQVELITYQNQKMNLLKKRDSIMDSLTIESNLELYESLFKLLSDKNNLEIKLKSLKDGQRESEEEFFILLQDKKDLELKLELLNNKEGTQTRLIALQVATKKTGMNASLFILVSFIFGLMASIIIVFLQNDFRKKS